MSNKYAEISRVKIRTLNKNGKTNDIKAKSPRFNLRLNLIKVKYK